MHGISADLNRSGQPLTDRLTAGLSREWFTSRLRRAGRERPILDGCRAAALGPDGLNISIDSVTTLRIRAGGWRADHRLKGHRSVSRRLAAGGGGEMGRDFYCLIGLSQ